MHRVGRTARNGKGGAATHLYAAEDGAAELMEGLEAASRAGDTIDPMFSRKRLLRKKLKRYGEIRADPTEAVGKHPFTYAVILEKFLLSSCQRFLRAFEDQRVPAGQQRTGARLSLIHI